MRIVRNREKKVNIELSDETHTKVKIIAALKKITLASYLQKAVEDAVKKDKDTIEKMKTI